MDLPVTDEIKVIEKSRPKHASRKLWQAFLNIWSMFSVATCYLHLGQRMHEVLFIKCNLTLSPNKLCSALKTGEFLKLSRP